MSDPKVIYLGPECEDEFCDGRTWADHVAWPDCDCKHKPVRYNLGSDYDAALAREAALREELGAIKSKGSPHFCGYPMSKNPHEDAGKPGRFLEVGAVSECIPCLVSSRHGWAKKAGELQQRLTDAEKRNSALEEALKFYADGDHLLLADTDAWDTCSGEPINFLHDEAGTASVEDGSIAKAALKPVEGEGS